MDLRVENAQKKKIVRFPEKATVEEVAEMKEQILPLLKKKSTIELDLGVIEKTDTAFLQFLVAMYNSAQKLDVQLLIGGSGVSPSLIETGKLTGFILQNADVSSDTLRALFRSFGEEENADG